MFRRCVGALALVTLTVAGCTSSTTGSGKSSSANGTGAASGPAGAASSPPAPPPTSHPNPKYVRTPGRTLHGDPVTVNYCASLGTKFVTSLHLAAVPGATQYLPGCTLDLHSRTVTKKGTKQHVTVGKELVTTSLVANDPHDPTVSFGKHAVARVRGLKVEKYPFNPGVGYCVRIVTTPSVNYEVLGFHATALRGSPLICEATDLVVRRIALLSRAKRLPQFRVPTPSVMTLDFCKVLKAAPTTAAPQFKPVSYQRSGFGLTCEGENKTLEVGMNLVRAPAPTGPTVTVGYHKLVAKTTDGYCLYSSVQGRIPSSASSEVVQINFAALDKLPAGSCDQAKGYAAAILDTAGLV